MNSAPIRIQTVISEMFAENAYIAHLDGRAECVVFDPGSDHGRIIAGIERAQLRPACILNTHGHGDHILGNAALKQRWPAIPLVIGAGDAEKLTDPTKNLSAGIGIPFTSPPADQLVQEGDVLEFAGLRLEVLETPGHSSGHVVFVCRDASPWVVFAGDVLFQGSIGRTDFPDGSMRQLAQAIHQKLFTMPDDTLILPGHGPSTTIGEEKQHNPFVGKPAGWSPE